MRLLRLGSLSAEGWRVGSGPGQLVTSSCSGRSTQQASFSLRVPLVGTLPAGLCEADSYSPHRLSGQGSRMGLPRAGLAGWVAGGTQRCRYVCVLDIACPSVVHRALWKV